MSICVFSKVFCVFPACQTRGEFNRFVDFLTHRADIVQIIDSCFRYFLSFKWHREKYSLVKMILRRVPMI